MKTLSSKRSRKNRRLSFQALEDREMMAADVQIVAVIEGLGGAGGYTVTHELRITGTDQRDVVEVAEVSGSLEVTTNGMTQSFALSDVDRIRFYGKGGNDFFRADTNLSVFADGGAGIDDIQGGDGDDYLIGGADGDLIEGKGGNDIIHGGSGNDYLFGNGGNDVIFGDDGHDVIFGGFGSDFLFGGAGNDDLKGSEEYRRAGYCPHAGGCNYEVDPDADVPQLNYLGGGSGNDKLFGGVLDNGGSGDDVITVGLYDIVKGGDGADDFHLYTQYNYPEHRILDYSPTRLWWGDGDRRIETPTVNRNDGTNGIPVPTFTDNELVAAWVTAQSLRYL